MQVIDIHLHVGTKDNWTPWVIDFFSKNNPFFYKHFSEKTDPDRILQYLNSQGVKKGIILAEYAPKATGVVTNEFVCDFCKNHSDLIPFGSICLYDGRDILEQARYAHEILGVKGFKMLPSYAHFYPNEERLFPFYEYLQSKNIPVMFHTGTSIFKGSLVKYADPIYFDEIADAFPDLKIILEHGGRPFWYNIVSWLLTRHNNIYVGIAGIPTRHLTEYFPQLEAYQDRFLFGSDWPGVPEIKPLIEKVLALPISNTAKEKILWKNAANILGIEK
ncbi:MAG TPA: amidohydrolase family protein [Syntrophorhabdaceae bacterium]|mgnify:CR=1 FL=1|nr:amidohydrolase family protein [Syntrophorhabdaceae bacterium]HPU30745.1 amidohydrolase family protein [Syntrophorhabdaceae bacterium]